MKCCKFCDLLVANTPDVILQYKDFYVALDECPQRPGDFLIIPKKHIVTELEFTLEELGLLTKMTYDVPSMLSKLNLVPIYEFFIKNADPNDKKLIERCRESIDFYTRYPNAVHVGFNTGFNEGELSGKKYEHFHRHVCPTYVENPSRRGFRARE
ncbi:HIT family protein [Desulfocastanea catecholica]